MVPRGWNFICGNRYCGIITFTIFTASNMAEIFQIQIFEKYRESGQSVFLSLYSDSNIALLR